jgi:hypothetical protein
MRVNRLGFLSSSVGLCAIAAMLGGCNGSSAFGPLAASTASGTASRMKVPSALTSSAIEDAGKKKEGGYYGGGGGGGDANDGNGGGGGGGSSYVERSAKDVRTVVYGSGPFVIVCWGPPSYNSECDSVFQGS